MSRQNPGGAAGFIDTVRALTKPLKADRLLPPLPGTPAEAFERLYAGRADPWGALLSPIAHQRYLALVEAVGTHTPCDSILDVGCGEGSFTRYLVGQARRVVGIDASQTAIERARRLVPKAAFWCGTPESFGTREIFDVVLAVEVLYYVPDLKIALDKLLALGRTVIVAYTSRETVTYRDPPRPTVSSGTPCLPSLLRAEESRLHDCVPARLRRRNMPSPTRMAAHFFKSNSIRVHSVCEAVLA
jgi:2-polyprenyl-3-methyl-5-hydroxy-6-metoxy-1,4-benzoquinol methylase